MPISFPTSPTTNQTYTYEGKTWTWTGSVWRANSSPALGATGPTGPASTVPGPTGPAGFFPSTTVSSNITLAGNNKYFVNTTVARTLTLPASPTLGDEIQVFDETGTAGTNNITVLNNSNKVNGVLDSALIDANGVAAVFVWTGSTYGWRLG